MRRADGFTIVEMMIVIAVLGVLTAVAVPGFLQWLPGYRLKGAVSTLRGDLFQAKMAAIKQGVPYRVAFTTGGYEVQKDEDGAGTFKLETSRDFSDYPGVFVASSSDPVFYPRGISTNASIVLKYKEQKQQKITVSVTGRIRVNE